MYQLAKKKPKQANSIVNEVSLEHSASLEEGNLPSHFMERIS